MSRPLEKRLAIITGASRGLGAGLARHLAAKGANILIVYTSDASTAAATDLAAELESKHSVKTAVVQVDITTPSGPDHLIEKAKSAFTKEDGTFQIDILINNAGVVNPAPLGSVTLSDFDATFQLNARAPLFVLQAAIPYLPNDRSGRVINVSSITTSMGFWWQSCYAGTKGALEAMTRVWARELGERCTVNSINPGAMATGMYTSLPKEMLEKVWSLNYMAPLAATREGIDSKETIAAAKDLGGRPAYLEEVAGVVGLLCMPEAGWITGQVIGSNGGGVMTKG
ncbi:short chain dehydrogenase [Cucurbitaria berberidis CBS 394.84]|uniref:Short chain dehydrogenase n=1 Tax=Cucurbitaria berberidis CBS 394.84 TaxID=1168544 RepID=A0A9P4GIR6_9PLEO|nr:short chain dehydrogenase [Cucurbitaria berberidis CBS 394.84]KAF1846392.1 short chain dehydrogenase [Cucurbitaria berberidis CBS 394.84]